MGKKLVGILGVIASFAGIVATVVGNWADKRETEIMVDERIALALAEKDEEKKEESEEETKGE